MRHIPSHPWRKIYGNEIRQENIMRWHLMYMVDETRGGRTYDESSFSDWMGNEDVRGTRLAGHALLRHTEYERWKHVRFGRMAFTGRRLNNGRWGPDQPLSGFFLENAHRFVARLPRSRIDDAYAWEQTLPIHDVDRFHDRTVLAGQFGQLIEGQGMTPYRQGADAH